MITRTRRIAASGAVIVLAIGAFLSIRSYLESNKPPSTVSTAPLQEAAAKNLATNPVEQWRDTLDRRALEQSLACIDAKGIMSCGKYSGQQGLVYLTLTGSHARIPAVATREILVSQGDAAVAAAAALGDLEAVKVLVAQGMRYGLLDEKQLQKYPLFAGSDEMGAHPAGSAAEFGHVNVLSFFVDRGFDVNSKLSKDGVTDLLLQALLRQKIEVMRYLFDNGYRIDCTFRFRNGRTYEDLAEGLGFAEGASLIREKCPQS